MDNERASTCAFASGTSNESSSVWKLIVAKAQRKAREKIDEENGDREQQAPAHA